jgi:hypothetical protein
LGPFFPVLLNRGPPKQLHCAPRHHRRALPKQLHCAPHHHRRALPSAAIRLYFMVKQRQYLTIAAAYRAATLLFSAQASASQRARGRQSVGRRRRRRIGRKRRPRYGTHDEQQRWFGGQRFTGAARWSLDYLKSYWWTDYVQHPGVNDVRGFLYDEFRATFRIPKPMFDDILRRMRDSGVFENDNPHGRGRPWSSQDGNTFQAVGVWVLCDTGYHKWRQTIMMT